ncbi:fatty acid synthase-like [Plakobranchus ocellatus]|uniref:Fatty acid synthase-like n=1 Tax=Plakobranchus ocellatus TaxID=259542 RepID=A0AAV4AEC0_9GAST|nr:fatty acid synthase-like [Plakobranchus ocellatus]
MYWGNQYLNKTELALYYLCAPLLGPSCAYDTACSTSLVCIDAAERHIRQGIIDAAIVGGCNLMYMPQVSKVFMGMNFLSTSACKVFDAAGDGFIRAEVVSAMFLKKRDTAKRIYATLVTAMTNNDGFQPNGMASLSKLMIIMHSKIIPPNLHLNTPNPNIPGLFDGRLKVVTEPTPFEGGLVAINSFGMGGTNAHAIFRSFDKEVDKSHPASNKPRLFVYSARTEEGLGRIFEEAHKHAANMEFHALCQQSANNKLKSMPYRGATILNATDEYMEINKCPAKPREIWFIYSGMGSQWLGMGRGLMALDIFRGSIQDSAKILEPLGIDLMDILTNGTEESLETIMNPLICICAVQLGLTDLLKSMGVNPDGVVGHSLGELGCAYADGCLTRREAILSAYWRGQVIIEGNVEPGRMAAVEMTWVDAKNRCPPGVVAACHNSQDSVTISGGEKEMTKFLQELKDEGIVVKEVNSNNISFHSHYMKNPSVHLRKALEKEIIPKPRSKRWISTSIPEHRWDEPLAQNAGANYHVNNMLSPVLFYEGLQKVPSNAIAIEIAPSGLLQSVIRKTLGSDCVSVSLQKRKHDNNLEYFFTALGKCYAYGMPLNPLSVYPSVQFPVSSQTPMLSNVISEAWDHSIPWRVPLVEDFVYTTSASSDKTFDIDISDDSPDRYLADHEIDGRILFPGSGTLVLAWKTLASIKGVEFEQMRVQLTNVQIHQALFLDPSKISTVSVSVMPITGEFQVRDNDSLLSSGVVTTSDDPLLETDQHLMRGTVLDGKAVTEVITASEVYRELVLRGYEYGPYFQGIRRASLDCRDTDIRWDGKWISYLDTVLHMCLLAHPGTHQSLPLLIESVIIDPTAHPPPPPEGVEPETIPGHYDPVLDIAAAGGVEFRGSHTVRSSRRLTHAPPTVEDYTFAPYMDPAPTERSAAEGMKQWLANDKLGVLPNKEEIEEALDLADKLAGTIGSSANFSSAKARLEALVNSQNGHKISK